MNDVSFSPDGTLIASASDDTTVRILAFPSLKEQLQIQAGRVPVNCVCFNRPGKTIQIGMGRSVTLNPNTKHFFIDDGREINTKDIKYAGVLAIHLSFFDNWRIVADISGITSLDDYSRPMPMVGHDRDFPCWDAAFFEDEPFVATAGGDGRILIWGMGQLVRPVGDMVAHQHGVLSISPGYGKTPHLASAGKDNKGKVWANWHKKGNWDLVCELVGHDKPIGSIAFSPDNKLLATGSADHTVRIWDAETGKHLHTFTGHTDAVTSVAFHQQRRHLVSAGADNTVRLWQLGTELVPAIEKDWHALEQTAKAEMIKGNYANAIKIYDEAIPSAKDVEGRNDPSVAIMETDRVLAELKLGEIGDLEPVIERALKILSYRSPAHRLDAARAHQVKAILAKMRGDLQSAMSSLQGGVETQLRLEKSKDPIIRANMLHQRGLLHFEMAFREPGKIHPQAYPAALADLQSSLKELNNQPKDLALRADILTSIAETYLRGGEPDKALPRIQEAASVYEATRAPDHFERGIAYRVMGDILDRLGRSPDAEKQYRQCLAVLESSAWRDATMEQAKAHRGLALCCVARQDWEQARQHAMDCRQSIHRYTQEALPRLSSVEQQNFLLYQQELGLDVALSLALHRPADQSAVESAAECVINSKGLTNQLRNQQVARARKSADPRVATVLSDLKFVRRQLANISMHQRQVHDNILIYTNARQEFLLEKELSRLLKSENAQGEWSSLADLRNVLPDDGVLVEIRKFQRLDLSSKTKAESQSEEFAAWVIPPVGKGSVQIISLGSAEQINLDVVTLRRNIQRTFSDANSEKSFMQSSEKLAEKLLKPILKAAPDCESWILSPHASLWFIPWEVLPVSGTEYAIEKYVFSYAISGKDLFSTEFQTSDKTSLIFANPTYGAGKDELMMEVTKVLPRAKFPSYPEIEGQPKPELQFNLLPGTHVEALAVRPALEKWTKSSPRILESMQAQEQIVKQVVGPRVLLLSTHGFYIQQPELPPIPLINGGLAFAGANEGGDGRDDGILTSIEVLDLNLEGTELVVLSACETGLGEAADSEGVTGLRKAFELAGARSVVATLWSVPDKESAELMQHFFNALADDKDKAEALAIAKRTLIKALRSRHQAAAPKMWAAYTLTGHAK